MSKISPGMTIQEAAALWSDPSRILLDKWIEYCNLPLEQLRVGHTEKYDAQRALEVDRLQIMAEVATLRALLRAAGTGKEIHEAFLSPEEKLKLKPSELAALPARARAYIGYLEERVDELKSENARSKDSLRKANWARWNGSR